MFAVEFGVPPDLLVFCLKKLFVSTVSVFCFFAFSLSMIKSFFRMADANLCARPLVSTTFFVFFLLIFFLVDLLERPDF